MAIPQYNQIKTGDKLNEQVQDENGIQVVGAGSLAVGRHYHSLGTDYTSANPYAESSTQLFPLGARLDWGDRAFVYVQMDGAVTAGKLIQQTASIVANHSQCTATATTAVGQHDISIETQGDTDLTADLYAGGYLIVNDQGAGTGEGQSMRIKSHPAHDHSDDASVVISCFEPLVTALTTASELTLTKNPWKDVIVAPAAETGAVIGATNIDMTDNYFGWLQVRGPKAMLAGETLVLGHQLMRSDADAGAVMPNNSDDLCQMIGTVMASTVVDTEYALCYLQIA